MRTSYQFLFGVSDDGVMPSLMTRFDLFLPMTIFCGVPTWSVTAWA